MSLIKSLGGKKVNFDFNKDFISVFSQKIKDSDFQFINQTLKDLHPSDVANLIENLSTDTRAKLIEIEEFNIDPEIFIKINDSIQSEVLQLLSTDSVAKILKRLESDNSIAILENLETAKKKDVLDKNMELISIPDTYFKNFNKETQNKILKQQIENEKKIFEYLKLKYIPVHQRN